MSDTTPARPSLTAEQRAESLRDIAASSAETYVDGISEVVDKVPREVLLRQAFADGFLSCVELLLTVGEKGSQP